MIRTKSETLVESSLAIIYFLSICGIVVSFLSMIPIMLNSIKIISLSIETRITILNSSVTITIISAISLLVSQAILETRIRKSDSICAQEFIELYRKKEIA